MSKPFAKTALAACMLLVTPAVRAAVPGASSYVQSGLIAQWDGIENVGAGLPHDSSSRTWADLSGNGWDFTLDHDRAGFGDDYFEMRQIASTGNDASAAHTAKGRLMDSYTTIEVVWQPLNAIQDILNTGNANFGFYPRLYKVQFGTQNGTDKFRYDYITNQPNEKVTFSCVYTNKTSSAGKCGFVNGAAVDRTDSGATSGYYQNPAYTTLGGRYGVTDWGGSGRIYAMRLTTAGSPLRSSRSTPISTRFALTAQTRTLWTGPTGTV